MLDMKMIREKTDYYVELLNRREGDFSYLHDLVKKDQKRREIIVQVEKIKALRNETSKKIGLFKREGKDVSSILKEIENIGDDIKKYQDELRDIETFINQKLLSTPNIPHEEAPIGNDDSENVEIKVVGEIPTIK